MKKALCSLWIVFVISFSMNSGAASGESCRFLSTDFPKLAAKNREAEIWTHANLAHFLSGEALKSARMLIANERQECVTFENLPAARTVRMIGEQLLAQDKFQMSDWQGFLSALEHLTCDKIHQGGDLVPCPNVRLMNFIEAARRAALAATTYDRSYARIDPVEGDIASDRGVCSDVIVRGLRTAGIDLQDLVYRDVQKRLQKYRLLQKDKSGPDRNIDHRRVTNLMVYFEGDIDQFATLKPPDRDWMAGDIVVWNLKNDKGFLPHIGVVSDRKGSNGEYLVIHHLPPQGREDDKLHGWTIIGHFRPLLGD